MTPFEQWFENKGAAELTRIYLESMLAPVRTESDRKQLVKQVAMTCWNAAIDRCISEYLESECLPIPKRGELPTVFQIELERLRA